MSTTSVGGPPVPAHPSEPSKTKPPGKVRKRAAKACLSCRARKVRCDVSQRGRPCMNCYLDSETCVVTGRASRFRRDRGDNVEASYPPYVADNHTHARAAEDAARARRNGESASPTGDRQESPDEHDQDEREASMEYGHDLDPAEGEAQGSRPPMQSVSHSTNPDVQRNTMPPPGIKEHNTRPMPDITPFLSSEAPLWVGDQQVTVNADITYSYYPFLNINNLHNIMPQDVNYLEAQGCFRVPTRDVLDEFVQQYFLHIHPMLPMINEGDFWAMYGHFGHGGSGDKMSLLVFQSMLFVSCNFVSKSSIKAIGFPSIRAARAALYRRCKLLYDLDTEFSVVHLAQAALLLSHWSPNFTHAFKKANSMWLGIAIQNAKSAEAHHYSAIPSYSPAANPLQFKKQNILKRLWWCCIVRDRILPLGLRRSLKITRSHFDFDAHPGLGYADLADEVDRSKVYNSGTKRCLIEIFVQIVELGTVLTDLLMLVFPLDDSPGWGKQGGSRDSEKVRECRQALRRWYKGATLRFPMFGGDAAPRVTVSGGREFQHDSVILYTNLMYMYYHSARVALSHHEVLQTAVAAASPNLTSNLKEFSNIYENRHELQDAASGVTECLKELIQLRLARWLPISAVASTALPLVLHIIDVKLSSYNKGRNSSAMSNPKEAAKQHRLNILIEAMKTYQPQYDGVDYVSETIRHIVNLAQLDAPTPPSQTANTISDWQDILASQPGCYLRLAMTMDLSLSKGRLPEEADFPISLRGLFTAGYSSIKALIDNGKTNLAPLPYQQQNPAFATSTDPAFVSVANIHTIPGTVYSLSSDGDTDSPRSLDDQTTAHQTLAHTFNDHAATGQNGDAHMAETSFVEAALEMEGLAGGALVGYSLHNDDSPPSSASEDSGLFDGEEAAETDWIGNAWGQEVDMGLGDKNDHDTAMMLLDALRDGEGLSIECGA